MCDQFTKMGLVNNAGIPMGNDEDDDDLENELYALMNESLPKEKQRKGSRIDMSGLEKMVAESMRNINSDDEMSDTEDPDLLSELYSLANDNETPPYQPSVKAAIVKEAPVDYVSILQSRLSNYSEAKESATQKGDSAKVKRLERGLKSIQSLLKTAKSGKPIDVDEIPPQVAVTCTRKADTSIQNLDKSDIASDDVAISSASETISSTSLDTSGESISAVKSLPTPSASECSSSHVTPCPVPISISTNQESDRKLILSTRKDQYKLAAMRAKGAGYGDLAMKYLKTSKQFDLVLAALENGQAIDLSNMPPPPPGFPTGDAISEDNYCTSSSQSTVNTTEAEDEPLPQLSNEDKSRLFDVPSEPKSVLEALQQRSDKYESAAHSAKAENNASKARRMGRIYNQYQEAIKLYTAGKPVDLSDLPTPPGFPPFPSESSSRSQASSGELNKSPQPMTNHISSPPKKPESMPRPVVPKSTFQRNHTLSKSEQHAKFLQERQAAFKKLALEAKRNGDLELAKKYLRNSKGLERMVDASLAGLPVDLSQVPALPTDEDFEFVDPDALSEDSPVGDRDTMFKKLEQDLINQIKISSTNSDHFTKLGDVTSAAKFDKMGTNARKEMDALKNAYKHGDPVPRFHYETRTFSLVQCCTELGDNDMEIILIRGINYGLPSDYKASDLDTYVKFEFPYPNDDPQKGCSETVKNTNCPEYNHTFKVQVQRKARTFLRILKSKSIKLDVFYRRGFFKSDKLLGSVSVKLSPLDNQCVIHECYDLMDGRKAIGGKLEIKMRIRDPFISKQVEEVKEKWVVIDRFDRATVKPDNHSLPDSTTSKQSSFGSQTVCMEVMKYEKQLLDEQIGSQTNTLSLIVKQTLQNTSRNLQQSIDNLKDELYKGGMSAMEAYVETIEKNKSQYLQEAQLMVKQGNKEKAQILLNKKKLVEKEVEAIRGRLLKQ